MSTPSTPRTRVIASFGDPGKWQAQYQDPNLDDLWCDIGDAQVEKTAAEDRERAYIAERTTLPAEGKKVPTIVVVGNGYWGAGETLEEAKKRFRQEGGALAGGYGIMTFDADTTFHGIDNMGHYGYTGNAPAIEKVNPRKTRTGR